MSASTVRMRTPLGSGLLKTGSVRRTGERSFGARSSRRAPDRGWEGVFVMGWALARGGPVQRRVQTSDVTAIPIAAAAITPVASQPTARRTPVTTNLRMILGFEVMSIIITITGTATTPLITALQNNALIGSMGERLIATPASVAVTIVA